MSNGTDDQAVVDQAAPAEVERGRDEVGPYVIVNGLKIHIAVVDRGLIPPWDGFSISKWWSTSRFNPLTRLSSPK
ncbi:MAG: hypothetical protein OXD50_15100 [Chloroflexi bacterium]|nr:hypothetical protein [Chloroflexota bacterium]